MFVLLLYIISKILGNNETFLNMECKNSDLAPLVWQKQRAIIKEKQLEVPPLTFLSNKSLKLLTEVFNELSAHMNT